MEDNIIIACICEGGAEHAIMDILLDNHALIFAKRQLLDDRILRVRSASNFEQNHLRKNFDKKIKVYRILDSRRENFKLSKLYNSKVEVINVITAPEIEMLIIHGEDKYEEFKKSKKKPSDYCKQDLNLKSVKTYPFVKSYFSEIEKLFFVIKLYNKKAKIRIGEVTLFSLLRKEHQ